MLSLLAAASSAGCNYRDSSDIPTAWGTANTVVTSSWFNHQATAYIDKSDLKTADTFLEKAEIRVNGWGYSSVTSNPDDLNELIDSYVTLQVDRTRALRREIRALEDGNDEAASAEKKKRSAIATRAEELLKSADFDDLSDGDVPDQEFWREFHLQESKKNHKLAPRIVKESKHSQT
ncbi:MAG TPA: hypothetical protein PLD65_07660 [Solirubrobacterales bacterium]|nr:hypothetical protein [Solirubrobacterales bacterium]